MRKVITSAVGTILAAAVASLCFLRYLSPTDWKRLATSPRRVVMTAIAYREVLRLEPEREQRRLRNYEVILGKAAPGETHIIYVPRIDIDDRPADPAHPGANMRVRPGIEAHVLLESETLRIKRSYLAKM